MSRAVDRASEYSELMLDAALADQRRRAAVVLGSNNDPTQWRLLSAVECEGESCGETIPDERRQLLPGVRLCVDCQARLEKGYGK